MRKGAAGLRTGKIENKIALRCVQNADIFLDDCFVPDAARLPGVTSFKVRQPHQAQNLLSVPLVSSGSRKSAWFEQTLVLMSCSGALPSTSCCMSHAHAVSCMSHAHAVSKDLHDHQGQPLRDTSRQAFEESTLAGRRLKFQYFCALQDTAKVLAISRIMVAWQPVGIAAGVFDMCVRYTGERQQFGAALGAFQLVQERLARMLGNVQAMFLMCWRLSKLYEQVSRAFLRVHTWKLEC